MASIIKNKNIYDKSEGNPVKELTEHLKKLVEVEKLLVTQNKAVAESIDLIKKSSDGKEAKALTETTKKLTAETKKLKKAKSDVQIVSEKLVKENKKLNQTYTPQAKALAIVRQKTLQQNKALREQAKATIGVRKGISGMTKSILGSLGLVGGITALVGVFKKAFETFTLFSKSSSKLAAILDKTKKGISSLTDQAKNLGATTAFTASQVIELQTELAKLGFSLRDIEASTPGILALAAATGTDLASAAELAGATLRIFNLDASQMSRVTDVLAKSTTISSLSMEKLATILPTVGKTAQIAGVSLERTAALAGTLTDRGLDASSAATSLRNIFLELSKQGLTWNEAMTKINESTDKNKTSMDLFGKRAAAAGVILSETAEDTDKLTTSLNNASGAAQEMADTMLNNLSGDITKANSAWEGFILSLADGTGTLSNAFRSLTQTWTEFLGGLQKINEESFGTKMKVVANGFISIINAISFGGLDDALKNLTQSEEAWRFNTDKTIGSLKLQKSQIDKNEKSTRRLTTAEKKLLKQERLAEKNREKNEKAAERRRKKREKEAADEIKRIKKVSDAEDKAEAKRRAADLKTGGDPVQALSFNDEIESDKRASLARLSTMNDDFRRREADQEIAANAQRKAREIELGDALLTIKDAAIGAAGQILADSISFGIDARVAAEVEANDAEMERNSEQAETAKVVLEQQLQDGIITEKEFKEQSEKIDADLRKKNEKLEKDTKTRLAIADKKKALFDIGIATAVGVARVIPNPIAMAAAVILGGFQLAVVAARPIPKFEKGGKVGGELHSNGGTLIEAQKDEFVLSREGYAGAEKIADWTNRGLLKDKDIEMMQNQDSYNYNMLQLNGLVDELRANGNLTKETNEILSKTVNVNDQGKMLAVRDYKGNIISYIIKN